MNDPISFTLHLTLRGPLFIGSGRKIGSKEYYYNEANKTVAIFDERKFQKLLVDRRLADHYESYMLTPKTTLRSFVDNNGGFMWFRQAVSYTINNCKVLGENGQTKELHTFVRDGNGNVYVPGSSIKGMLRTALTVARVLQNTPPIRTTPPRPFTTDEKNTYLKGLEQTEHNLNAELFHTLRCETNQKSDALNSIFRGLSVADSAPINVENLILCSQNLLSPGKDSAPKKLDMVRECLRPGTEIAVAFSIDPTLAKSITKESIQEAIKVFDNWYQKNVLAHYVGNWLSGQAEPWLFLGGGVGFQSKTVVEPWLGEKALDFTSAYLALTFLKDDHLADKHLGISPRRLKYANDGVCNQLFGLCEVELK